MVGNTAHAEVLPAQRRSALSRHIHERKYLVAGSCDRERQEVLYSGGRECNGLGFSSFQYRGTDEDPILATVIARHAYPTSQQFDSSPDTRYVLELDNGTTIEGEGHSFIDCYFFNDGGIENAI